MEKLKGSVYITPKDIQILNDCHINQARAEHRTVCDSLEVNPKKLTVKEYCAYWKVDYDCVVSHLNPYR